MKVKLDNMSKAPNHWLTRDITIFGWNFLAKSEGRPISKMVYPTYALYITLQNIKRTNSIIYQFIWRNKTHYIRKSPMIKEYDKGDIKTIDFESMVGVFTINWMKAFFPNLILYGFISPRISLKKWAG